MKKFAIVLTILNIIAISCLILAYGPDKSFRDYFVTTALDTYKHQYLARVLYSEETINQVMKENYIVEPEESSEPIDIVIEEKEPEKLYEVVEFKKNGYNAYLTIIYDPSRVTTVKSNRYGKYGQRLEMMAKENNAIVAINGGGFNDPEEVGTGSNATGIFISQGKIIEDRGLSEPIIGINNDNVLVLKKMTAQEAINSGIRDAVCFGPYLIVNGQETKVYGNGGYGQSPRTAIGQRKDGTLLFLIVDGGGSKVGFRGGATIKDLIDIFKEYGAYNAANLDGGASSSLVIDGVIKSHPVAISNTGERAIPNGWILK